MRLAVALAVLVPAFAGCGRNAPPNLLVVLVDTLRPDHLGYHGYARDTSPRVDALAAQSIVFDNHYAHASRTGPSVASLITGLHPRSHGVVNPLSYFDAKGTLTPQQITLAELLYGRGYTSHGVVTNVNVSPNFGFAQGFESYQYLQSMSGADVNRAALEALDGTPEPFFLYLHYMEPHSGYEPPPQYRERYVDPAYDGPIFGSHDQINAILTGRIAVDAGDRAHLEGLYDAEIRYFDFLFGELLDALDRKGLRDNTIIVFASDHGEEFFEHGSVLHGYTLYEEQLRVPLFIHDPRSRSGKRIGALTRHIDVLPTLFEMMGLEIPAHVQGTSLVPLIDGVSQPPPHPPPVFAQVSLKAVKTVQLHSFTAGGWKLIETRVPTFREELYHLAEDPTEQRDVIAERPQVAAQMRQRMREFIDLLPVGRTGVVELTDDEKKRLRALGYLR